MLELKKITAANFRNLQDKEVVFSPKTNILVGHNAVGKTNTIEAIQLLTSGDSFRHPTPVQLITKGQDTGRIQAEFIGNGRYINTACEIRSNRRHFYKNDKACSAHDLLGTLFSVLFTPDDLSFVKGSASYRRQAIDSFGCQANESYSTILATYLHSVEQRNRLLKEGGCSNSALEAWDDSIAYGGASLLLNRLKLFARLSSKTTEIYTQIVPSEELTCEYVSSTGSELNNATKEEIYNDILNALQNKRDEEQRRAQTLIGPHRDDVLFYINNNEARAFGSQGQQRTIALAWKIAEVLVVQELLGENPILLLDDVMSELDEQRRKSILNLVDTGIQTVITTTNLDYFSQETLKDALVIHYE